MSEPVWKEFKLRCMAMPEGYQDAELTVLLADILHSYKDLSLDRRRACLEWAKSLLDYAP
jgi:hypothetical protein